MVKDHKTNGECVQCTSKKVLNYLQNYFETSEKTWQYYLKRLGKPQCKCHHFKSVATLELFRTVISGQIDQNLPIGVGGHGNASLNDHNGFTILSTRMEEESETPINFTPIE